jgi:hypothetical protein
MQPRGIMSLSADRKAASSVRLEPLTRSQKIALLESAVLVTYERFGVPLSDAAEDLFQREVSALYRACLIARRSAPPRSFESKARTLATLHKAARQADT